MINGNTENFLDLAWINGSELFYKDHIYAFQGYDDMQGDKLFHLQIIKWRAKTYDHKTYVSIINAKGEYVDYDASFAIEEKDEDSLREKFLSSLVFEGKKFWDVQKELEWLEDSDKEETQEVEAATEGKQQG